MVATARIATSSAAAARFVPSYLPGGASGLRGAREPAVHDAAEVAAVMVATARIAAASAAQFVPSYSPVGASGREPAVHDAEEAGQRRSRRGGGRQRTPTTDGRLGSTCTVLG